MQWVNTKGEEAFRFLKMRKAPWKSVGIEPVQSEERDLS